MDDKVLKRLYIEETLKTRKYIGYRLDIALIKSILTVIIYILLYNYSKSIVFSVVIATQIFLILTLLNKIRIDKKIKTGKNKLLQRIKLKKFKNKIFYSDYSEIESFIMLYLNQYRYKDIKKIRKYSYSAIKDGEATNIFIMKYFEEATIEKVDIRNILKLIFDKKANRNLLFILNDMSDDARELLEKYIERLNIQTVYLEDIYKFADDSLLLSEEYEYKDIEGLERRISKKTKDLVKNVFINKKLILYMLAAIMFYMLHKTIFPSQFGIYISYYFIFLACINAIYSLYLFFFTRINKNKKQTN